MAFADRVERLPRLGVGLSTEVGAAASGTDPNALRQAGAGFPAFLEIGADVARGFDAATEAWIARGLPTTYHFLDLNLEEPEDLDHAWVTATVAAATRAGAAWLCGDAGLWHVGPRDRGHGTLLPPILCRASAGAMSDALIALRELTGFEVVPENPPAQVLVGDLHPLEYFARVIEDADCGLLLDVSHLAIVQRALGLAPTALLDAFPVERVLEVHVAGGRPFRAGPHTLLDDDHGPVVADDTWRILDEVMRRATSLRAVVVECEHNAPADVLALAARVSAAVDRVPDRGARATPAACTGTTAPIDHRRAQRTLFRMLLDPAFAAAVRGGTHDVTALGEAAGWLTALDPALVAADPGDRRKQQLLGNVALEFVATVRSAPPFLDGFTSSPEFHAAIAEDRPLVPAFAAYAGRVLPAGPWRDVWVLEAALADARRRSDEGGAGMVTLAPAACLVQLRAGTLAAAEALKGGTPAQAPTDDPEFVLIVGRGAPGPDRELHVEVVPEGLAELLRSLPWATPADAARFGAGAGLEPEELAGIVADLAADGIVARG